MICQKTEKKGRLCLFEFEWEGEGLGGGGRLFEAGHLLTFSTVRIGAYSRRVLTRGWALIRINTVSQLHCSYC